MWIYWIKGSRVGEWTCKEFATREEALAFALSRPGVSTTVSETPAHSTMPFERLTVHEDGCVESTRQTTIG